MHLSMWWLILLQVFTIWATNLGQRNGNIFEIKTTEDYTQHQPLQSTKESLKDKNTIHYDSIQLRRMCDCMEGDNRYKILLFGAANRIRQLRLNKRRHKIRT